MLPFICVLIFLVALVTLGMSSGVVARSFIKLSRVVGINEYVVSFILLGVITSLPELFIALSSLMAGVPILSLGNIIGANLTNITLALGLTAVLANGVETSRQVSKRVFWLSLLLAVLPSILVIGGQISRSDGFLLLFIFLGYLAVFAYDSQFLERTVHHVPYGVHYFTEAYPNLINMMKGLAMLVLSSLFIVFFSTSLTQYLNVDAIIFSIVFLGIVTSLPELMFGIRGAILQHPSLSLGNILASMVFNSTALVGLLAIVSPIAIGSSAQGPLIASSLILAVSFGLLSIFSYSGSRVTRLEGYLLLSLYLLFLVSVIFLY